MVRTANLVVHSVQVCVDLIPLRPARIRYPARRAAPHSGGTGVGPFGVVAGVAAELLGEFLPIAGTQAGGRSWNATPSPRRVANKIVTAEPAFAVQVLIRCVSPREIPTYRPGQGSGKVRLRTVRDVVNDSFLSPDDMNESFTTSYHPEADHQPARRTTHATATPTTAATRLRPGSPVPDVVVSGNSG